MEETVALILSKFHTEEVEYIGQKVGKAFI